LVAGDTAAFAIVFQVVEELADYGRRQILDELRRKLGDGGEEGGVTGLVIKPPEPPRWSVTP
jgi:hypothetical protein